MPTLVTGGNVSEQGNTTQQNEIVNSVTTSTEIVQTGNGETNRVEQVPVNTATPATPQIINQTVPIVVFVGPPSSGKSMILVRLAKYLRNDGYTIQTDPTFLNTASYQLDCQEFNDKLNTTIALSGSVKFLLVNVYKDGREVAKLLEAPGEDFYTTDPEKIRQGKNTGIEPYLSRIMTSTNPKSYVMLLDLDSDISFRNDSYHRESYSQRLINSFYGNIDLDRDRIVLLYNKIDKTPFGNIHGCKDVEGARKDAEMYYKSLFASMKIKRLGGFLTTDAFVFKTFCTGMFATQADNVGNKYQTYNEAADVFPKELWKEIISKW